MIHSIAAFRRVVVGALALLLACAASTSAQQLKLSDTIRLTNGVCLLQSTSDDKEAPPEVAGWQKCQFTISPSGFFRVFVPGNKDEIIICVCTIKPNGMIGGSGRENEGPGAYSAIVRGQTKPGTTPANLLKVGALIKVWESPNSP
jgi:hypothetical protein